MYFCVVVGSARAQSNPPFQNPSLDSNCYFPQIGVPGEIDTIYGDSANEGLGAFIHNLGPKQDGSPGNMLIGNGSVSPFVDWNETSTGPSFNLHNLKAKAQKLNLDPEQILFAHLHNQTSVDIFDYAGWIIYWADENGNYDSSRTTNLIPKLTGNTNFVRDDGGVFTYLAPMASDTVDDIVVGLYLNYFHNAPDSLFLLYFKGGSSLWNDTTKAQDSIAYLGQANATYGDFGIVLSGDFRGTGRQDGIIGDEQNNLYFFPNDSPFSLSNLVIAIQFDTIWPRAVPSALWAPVQPSTAIVMPLLPKKTGDHSIDFALSIPDSNKSSNSIYIFCGGPNFGLNRITIDSAAYVILPPASLGESVWPQELVDAGDMTGTGNQVLYVTASDDEGDYWYDNYYVTGKALDSKIDIYNSGPYSIHTGDTLTANADSLEDFLNDRSWLNATGPSGAGALVLTYGSKQIPVHLNPQFSDVVNIPQQNGAGILLSPNPAQSWSVVTIVWPEAEDGQYSIYDMLGRQMEHGPIQLYGGAEQQRIYFSGMAQGVYLYTIEGAHGSASARFVKLGGASGTSGTSQPSIIQSMKEARDGKAEPAGLTSPPEIR